MRLNILCAAIFLLGCMAFSAGSGAQAAPASSQFAVLSRPASGNMAAVTYPRPRVPSGLSPFSRFALAGALSPLGVDFQAAVNVNRFMNVRGTGNVFNYSVNDISVGGFNLDGTARMASAGASLDVYPWPNHGFRMSAGALFLNRNAADATLSAPGGTAFTLNGYTYYSSPSFPVTGTGDLNLHARNPAPTVTIGWGNLISRTSGRWSVPFEFGAAMIGDPLPTMAFTGGQVCADPQGTLNCQDVVGNSTLNANLQAQLLKYKNDLQPLRFYPIVSVGVGYSFPIRHSDFPASY